jgi:predicted metalloendopeptidase
MAVKTAISLVLLAAVLTSAQSSSSGLQLVNFDARVRPQDDLFRAVNGAWLARTPMPPDRVTYGAFLELADRTESDLRSIIERVAADRDRQRGTARQIADLYASLMDQARAEELGLQPIAGVLARIESIETPRELATEAGYLSAIALGGPFLGAVEEDVARPGTPIATIAQGGTLLPDRDYYLQDDARLVQIRAQYVDYLTSILTLAGRSRAAAEARAVLAFETAIARLQWTEEEIRDPARAAAKFALDALEREMPGFEWSRWARPQGIDRTGYVVLRQPSFFKGFAGLVEATPIETSKAWLLSRLLTASAPFLTRALSDARFEFFGRVLSGQELPRTHWKRGVSLVNGYLGDAVGRLYVERHFSAASRARVEKLVAMLVAAFRQAITEAGWMSESAKRSALGKLSKLTTRVGYPDRWRDYRGLVIKPDDLFGNVQRARQFDGEYKLRRLAQPDARGEWLMTPQTINAYYNPVLNDVVVPAAMLQPPLFNADADEAANYGAIGAIVGHEIAHGFYDQGRHLDGAGGALSWWTAADEQAFAAKAQGLVEQFTAYRPLEGVHVSGFITLRENVGDLSGLSIAWRAYKNSLAGRPSPVIDGFTGEQRFFLSWAQVWRGRIRDEYLRQTLLSTPHAPPEYRANGPASNMPGFHEAFGTKPGDGMYREPHRRITIW